MPAQVRGLSYTEIWISEAQERMVLAVPEDRWQELDELVPLGRCRSDGDWPVCADGRLQLYYKEQLRRRSRDGVSAQGAAAGRAEGGV